MEEEKFGKQYSLKAKILILLICPIIVISICSVVIVITVGTIVDSDKYDFGISESEELTVPEGNEAIGSCFEKLIIEASDTSDVRIEKGIDISISDIDGNITDKQKSLLNYFSSTMCDSIKSSYNTDTVEYGSSPECVQIGNFTPYITGTEAILNEEGTKISYTISIESGDNAFTAAFRTVDDNAAEYVKNQSTSACLIKDISAENIETSVFGESNKENLLTNISVERKYNVKADVDFLDDLSGLGKQCITFVCTIKEKQNIKYAGISIGKDKISLTHNGFETLPISANIAEDAGEGDFTLEFTSSDPKIVKVDPNGMVEAVSESKEPVTVTATLKYLGNTYTDSCTVTVGVPVEGIKVKPRKAEVSVGDTAEFEAMLEPKDATIDDVIWISEDEKVCTVDKNGTITAIASGETRIIAVSEDGYYMSASDIVVS